MKAKENLESNMGGETTGMGDADATTHKLSRAQIRTITRLFSLREGNLKDAENLNGKLLDQGIDYDNDIIIDSDDGIHIAGPTALRYHSGGSELATEDELINNI